MSIFSQSVKRGCRKSFSLIELLIVIAIMGALAALILPHFASAESDAKDAVCDYNQAGTVRFINMFRSANGVYPSGFHTGLNASGAAGLIPLSTFKTQPTFANLSKSTATALSADQVKSLQAAGIARLAYGDGYNLTDTSTAAFVAKMDDEASSAWYEVYGSYDESTGAGSDPDATSELKFNGRSFADILGEAPTDSVIVPLLAAPTMDWEKAYLDGVTTGKTQDSKVQIALAGKCPWPEDGSMRYYICFFLVNGDGSAAKLIGTSCPECGVLNQNLF